MSDEETERRAAKIAALQARREQLTAKIVREQGKLRGVARRRDTRRKIVVGAAVLMAMEKDLHLAARVRDLLARQVARDNDRQVIADLLPPSPALPDAQRAAS